MAVRSTETIVTFSFPFLIIGMDRTLPSGSYRLRANDEEMPEGSMPRFRRTGLFLYAPPIGSIGPRTKVYAITQAALDQALSEDSWLKDVALSEIGHSN